MATFEASWNYPAWSVGENGSAKYRGVVFFDPDTESEVDVEAAAIAALPTTYVGYFLNVISIRQKAYNAFDVTGSYKATKKPENNDPASPGQDGEFTFEVSVQNVRALYALAKVSSGAVKGATAPDNKGLVNVNADRVDGVDIPQPNYTFSETHYFSQAAISQAYKITLGGLVGTVNNGTFRGHPAGTLLSTGVSGSVRGTDQWRLRFQWAMSPNVSNLSIGDLTGITKRGWDYLELHYRPKADDFNGLLVREPYAYTVHQMMRYTNYAGFGIGS